MAKWKLFGKIKISHRIFYQKPSGFLLRPRNCTLFLEIHSGYSHSWRTEPRARKTGIQSNIRVYCIAFSDGGGARVASKLPVSQDYVSTVQEPGGTSPDGHYSKYKKNVRFRYFKKRHSALDGIPSPKWEFSMQNWWNMFWKYKNTAQYLFTCWKYNKSRFTCHFPILSCLSWFS